MDAGFGAAEHSYTIISMGGLSNRRARALPSRRSALPRPPEFEMDHQNSTVPKFHGVFDGLSERPGDMGDSQLGGGDRIALLEAGRKRLQQLREVRAEPRHAATFRRRAAGNHCPRRRVQAGSLASSAEPVSDDAAQSIIAAMTTKAKPSIALALAPPRTRSHHTTLAP